MARDVTFVPQEVKFCRPRNHQPYGTPNHPPPVLVILGRCKPSADSRHGLRPRVVRKSASHCIAEASWGRFQSSRRGDSLWRVSGKTPTRMGLPLWRGFSQPFVLTAIWLVVCVFFKIHVNFRKLYSTICPVKKMHWNKKKLHIKINIKQIGVASLWELNKSFYQAFFFYIQVRVFLHRLQNNFNCNLCRHDFRK